MCACAIIYIIILLPLLLYLRACEVYPRLADQRKYTVQLCVCVCCTRVLQEGEDKKRVRFVRHRWSDLTDTWNWPKHVHLQHPHLAVNIFIFLSTGRRGKKQQKRKKQIAVNFVLTRQHSSYYYYWNCPKWEGTPATPPNDNNENICMWPEMKSNRKRVRKKCKKEKEEAEKLLSEYNARNV